MNDDEIEKAIKNAKASLAIEGLTPSDEVVEITRRHLKGELSENEALEAIREFIKKSLGVSLTSN